MSELFNIIQAHPWPFLAGLLVVVLMILAETFGMHGDGSTGGDFFDFGGCDGGGDGGGCD
jgi:hypothetical protein